MPGAIHIAMGDFMTKQILILVALLTLSTQVMAQKVDFLVGSESKVTCDGENEADKYILQMSGGHQDDMSVFGANLRKSGQKLSEEIESRLFNNLKRGHTMAIEMEDTIKTAVCFAQWKKQNGKPNPELDQDFKNILGGIEVQIKKNRSEDPKSDDMSNEDVNRMEVNELFYANRGAIALIITIFGEQ